MGPPWKRVKKAADDKNNFTPENHLATSIKYPNMKEI